jgi:hypothetical protein
VLRIEQGLRVGRQERNQAPARSGNGNPCGNSGEAGQGTGIYVLGLPQLAQDICVQHPLRRTEQGEGLTGRNDTGKIDPHNRPGQVPKEGFSREGPFVLKAALAIQPGTAL